MRLNTNNQIELPYNSIINNAFQEHLAFGQIGESYIAMWLRKKLGYTLLPAYEKEINNGKGPRLFCPQDQLISPDFLGLKGKEFRWFEAKHKKVFTWYRKTQQWTTGIDKRHYHHYLEVTKRFSCDVWLLFLHQQNHLSPPYHQKYNEDAKHWPCPTGLFGINLSESHEIDHECLPKDNKENNGHGKSGMVYWNEEQLLKIATLDEVKRYSDSSKIFLEPSEN